MPQTTTWSSCKRIVASHTHATAQSAIAPPYGPGPGTHRCYSEGSAADVSKHREHCGGSTDTIHHQLQWLSAISSNPLKLEGYLQFVYGQPVQLKMLNESESAVQMLLNFYWNSVPGRGDFATMWSCFACTLHGLRPANVLWAPSEEALHAPGLTPGSPLSFPGFFVHPSRAAFDHIRGGVPDRAVGGGHARGAARDASKDAKLYEHARANLVLVRRWQRSVVQCGESAVRASNTLGPSAHTFRIHASIMRHCSDHGLHQSGSFAPP